MPFLKYSARYWGTHTKKDLSDNARTLALDLLNQHQDHISAVSLLEQVLHPSYIIATSLRFSGLHCASFFGIVELVTLLMNVEGCEIDRQDCTGSTPLAWAARRGHEMVVKLLLEQEDVDPGCPDEDGNGPLGWAAVKRHVGVVKLLFEREDVDPNRPDKDGDGPLSWAAIKGDERVVKLFLKREDIDSNRQNKNSRTPLRWTAIEGKGGVAQLLLERQGRGGIVQPLQA